MEESQELVLDAGNEKGSTMLENLPTSLSLVKKKRRSYGTTGVGVNESPQKVEQDAKETSNPEQVMDDASIATVPKSFGDDKDLFDMDDDFFDEDEFNHDEILNDDKQSDDVVNPSELDQPEDIVEDYTQGGTQDDNFQNEDCDQSNANISNRLEPDGDALQNENDDQLPKDQGIVTESQQEPSAGESIQKPEVSDQDILDTVDTLFSEVDINTVTVKDIVRSIEDLFQIKIKKARKAIIKERLFYLINKDGEDESEEEQEDEQEEEEKAKNELSDEDFEPENEEEDDLPESSRSRNSRTPKQRKPSYVKIHHEMMRKRQIAEAKVRAEELQDQTQKKLSEEDRKRAELIAKKFETDNEEIRIKRMEDRIGLLSKLEQKRLMILKEEEDMDMVLVSLKQNNPADTIVPTQDGESEDAESESDDDDSDDELDIIDQKTKISPEVNVSFKQHDSQLPDPSRKSSPKSVLAYFVVAGNNQTENSTKRRQFANPRVALRNALKAKQFENGNLWLAKELGYKDVQQHLKECNEVEKKTRLQIVTQEEARIRQAAERNERLKAIVKGEALEVEEVNDDTKNNNEEDERTTDSAVRNGVYDQSESEEENEEDDEEVALAREIEEEEEKEQLNQDQSVNDSGESEIIDQNDLSYNSPIDESLNDTIVDDSTQDFPLDTSMSDLTAIPKAPPVNSNASEHQIISTDVPISENTAKKVNDADHDIRSTVAKDKDVESDEEKEFDDSKHDSQPKVPKNAAWKEMLRKEAEQLKKQKALRKNGNLVEEEAEEEEEEEEEGVAGLEDFGFTLNTKKKETEDDEDNDDDMDDDDFEDIVDDVSDNEGDEAAGEAGRKAMALREEKARHKEIIRRMREGYDGKRGGIAGGGEARGNLRFDQLVAADNRDDARRLGLLNDDELDSDDENGVANDNDEIDDEEDLDKILKDRYLNRTEIPDEEFSDSDDDNEDEDPNNGGNTQAENDEDDKEQERLAKRFARRARMNRLLELHGDDKEFSQSRLIEKDQTIQMELKSIRNVHSKRRQASVSSFTFAGDSNSFHGFPKRQSSSSSSSGILQSKYLSSSSSLALAINQSRKRKASFLGTGTGQKAAIKAPSISLGHVVFGGESQQSNMSRSASLPTNKFVNTGTYKRSKSDTLSTSKSSLWSRVAAGGFQKNRK